MQLLHFYAEIIDAQLVEAINLLVVPRVGETIRIKGSYFRVVRVIHTPDTPDVTTLRVISEAI